MAGSWTSLQIATLAVDALTPLTVAALGVFFARASRRIEQIQWANQIVVTRRLDIFAQLAPGLNQLLCFATFVGGWKEIQPGQAIAIKRQPGRDHVRQPGAVLRPAVRRLPPFMTALFAMYASTDADAHLRAPIESTWGNRRNMPWWDELHGRPVQSAGPPASTTSSPHTTSWRSDSAPTCTSPTRPGRCCRCSASRGARPQEARTVAERP